MGDTGGNGAGTLSGQDVQPLRIILTGFRATGKSAVGIRLSRLLGYRFLDMDGELVARIRGSIADYVGEYGWPAFRQLERELLSHLARLNHVVISTGGGAVQHAQEWKELRKNSLVVWLQADAGTISERLRNDPASERQRPSLTGSGTVEEVTSMLAEREPLYRAGSDMAIATIGKSPEEIAALIKGHLMHTEHA